MAGNLSVYTLSPELIKRSALKGTSGASQTLVALVLPVDVEQHQLLQSKRLHIRVIDDVEAQIEQSLVLACVTRQKTTDVQFQFVEYLLVNITGRINEITEKLILFNGLQMLVRDFNAPGSCGIGLDFHKVFFLIDL